MIRTPIDVAGIYSYRDNLQISHAVKAGNTIYISGQVALDPDGNVVGEGNAEVQAEFIWGNIEKVLKDLSLWDKRNNRIMSLSGGMKRRVMIAKALSHEPRILFLDEPTAGVDVELRRDMWEMVRKLRENGTTIILTTHYIEEAEEMADRIGVIRQGEIILVEDKNRLMSKLGKKELRLQLQQKLDKLPGELTLEPIELSEDGYELIYTFDSQQQQAGVARLLRTLGDLDIEYRDLQTRESSLEEIFVGLVHE